MGVYMRNGIKYSGSGASNLSALGDVTISSPSDGQGLVYDSQTGKWENGSVGSASNLDDLQDVTITSASVGQVLEKDTNGWVNGKQKYNQDEAIITGVKNLLPSKAVSIDGTDITWERNSDGSWTANGTTGASGLNQVILSDDITSSETAFVLKAGISYIISGSPNIVGTYMNCSYWNEAHTARETVWANLSNPTTISAVNYDRPCAINIGVANNITVSDATFYPMLRFATIEDDTYEPYAMTNRKLTDELTNDYTKTATLTYAEYQALVDAGLDDPDTEYFVEDIETAATDYIETSVVTALTGATSLTITNSYITPTCRPRVFAQPTSCKTAGSTQYKVKAKISSITNGSCTLSFPALVENTEFKLLINAPEVSSPIITRHLSSTTQSATINAGAEYSATFDFTSQLDDDETIIGVFPDATGVAGLTIRIFYPNSTGKTATVVWRNTTSSSLTAPLLRVTVIAMKISL